VLVGQREPHRDKPLVRSDALARNAAEEHQVIRCHCLAHGQRKVREVAEVLPRERAVVTHARRPGCEHEAAARAQQWSAEDRLGYHQPYSGPLRATLKEGLEQQIAERAVEPTSSLGKAIADLLGHWETLTGLLTGPGAPLDNNTAARALKLGIRQRKTSLV
jgi:transposase